VIATARPIATLRDQLAALQHDLAGELVARGFCPGLPARLAEIAAAIDALAVAAPADDIRVASCDGGRAVLLTLCAMDQAIASVVMSPGRARDLAEELIAAMPRPPARRG
jgi:hypothetical protein